VNVLSALYPSQLIYVQDNNVCPLIAREVEVVYEGCLCVSLSLSLKIVSQIGENWLQKSHLEMGE
jgi:hypothetical protein